MVGQQMRNMPGGGPMTPMMNMPNMPNQMAMMNQQQMNYNQGPMPTGGE